MLKALAKVSALLSGAQQQQKQTTIEALNPLAKKLRKRKEKEEKRSEAKKVA